MSIKQVVVSRNVGCFLTLWISQLTLDSTATPNWKASLMWFSFRCEADLKQAIRGGDIMLVRRALALPGFNPDMIDTASGMTLLMWAATYGQDEVVKLLIRRGAGVNTEEKRNSMTALIHAAEQVRGNRDCVLWRRVVFRHHYGPQATTTTAKKTSLKNWNCILSNFIASIWTRSMCQMWAIFPGVEFLRTLSRFKKRKRNSSRYVYVLHKTSH